MFSVRCAYKMLVIKVSTYWRIKAFHTFVQILFRKMPVAYVLLLRTVIIIHLFTSRVYMCVCEHLYLFSLYPCGFFFFCFLPSPYLDNTPHCIIIAVYVVSLCTRTSRFVSSHWLVLARTLGILSNVERGCRQCCCNNNRKKINHIIALLKLSPFDSCFVHIVHCLTVIFIPHSMCVWSRLLFT